jgi:hypothetical protein
MSRSDQVNGLRGFLSRHVIKLWIFQAIFLLALGFAVAWVIKSRSDYLVLPEQ